MNNNTHKPTFYTAFIRSFMVLLVVSSILSSCQNEPSKQAVTIILPNTPESVCRAWQTYLDNNEIAKAMLLGNLATKNWLKENQDLFLADEQLEPTSFLTMICKESADTAICKYRIQEEEVIEDYFTLVREKGQWLIVIEEVDSNDPAEKAFEEMIKRLDL